ncbi:MAG: hypothetical protein E6431_36270 [Bradyrhizobium sp.]|jgi:hypothetical protein|nr:hypothetical protein [Bradyrhizobium sp.]NPU22200.1 hypothetical protein [Bradyrhizobium sp. LMG 8443]MDU1542537.1 hypothetical protein [Bradyrhizobium sp.]MDU2928540.1 hypothetical protein [Bradyrhizobium sp.]MDU3046065.1 hypothetical protein [Bradyrhizobium sp.]MDU6072481.1 hypothetical protein [Bradyrhizobium sp.]
MSVIMFSASGRQIFQSRTISFNADRAGLDEDAACLQARSVGRLITASEMPLADAMQARVLHLMT